MPQFNLLDTDTVTLKNILERSVNYKVPDFQRDYSWKEEQWEDLWEDIQTIRLDENPYSLYGSSCSSRSKGQEFNCD